MEARRRPDPFRAAFHLMLTAAAVELARGACKEDGASTAHPAVF
jgi:hypothetical protein